MNYSFTKTPHMRLYNYKNVSYTNILIIVFVLLVISCYLCQSEKVIPSSSLSSSDESNTSLSYQDTSKILQNNSNLTQDNLELIFSQPHTRTGLIDLQLIINNTSMTSFPTILVRIEVSPVENCPYSVSNSNGLSFDLLMEHFASTNNRHEYVVFGPNSQPEYETQSNIQPKDSTKSNYTIQSKSSITYEKTWEYYLNGITKCAIESINIIIIGYENTSTSWDIIYPYNNHPYLVPQSSIFSELVWSNPHSGYMTNSDILYIFEDHSPAQSFVIHGQGWLPHNLDPSGQQLITITPSLQFKNTSTGDYSTRYSCNPFEYSASVSLMGVVSVQSEQASSSTYNDDRSDQYKTNHMKQAYNPLLYKSYGNTTSSIPLQSSEVYDMFQDVTYIVMLYHSNIIDSCQDVLYKAIHDGIIPLSIYNNEYNHSKYLMHLPQSTQFSASISINPPDKPNVYKQFYEAKQEIQNVAWIEYHKYLTTTPFKFDKIDFSKYRSSSSSINGNEWDDKYSNIYELMYIPSNGSMELISHAPFDMKCQFAMNLYIRSQDIGEIYEKSITRGKYFTRISLFPFNTNGPFVIYPSPVGTTINSFDDKLNHYTKNTSLLDRNIYKYQPNPLYKQVYTQENVMDSLRSWSEIFDKVLKDGSYKTAFELTFPSPVLYFSVDLYGCSAEASIDDPNLGIKRDITVSYANNIQVLSSNLYPVYKFDNFKYIGQLSIERNIDSITFNAIKPPQNIAQQSDYSMQIRARYSIEINNVVNSEYFTFTLLNYGDQPSNRSDTSYKYTIDASTLFTRIRNTLSLNGPILQLTDVQLVVNIRNQVENYEAQAQSRETTTICPQGLYGPKCEQTTECMNEYIAHHECNHHGSIDLYPGSSVCRTDCLCETGWTGNDCFTPIKCQTLYTNASKCNGRGYIDVDYITQECRESCVCHEGFAGPSCEYITNCDNESLFEPCSSSSRLVIDKDPFTGICKAMCACLPSSSDGCSQNGVYAYMPDTNTCSPACTCNYGYYGERCQFSIYIDPPIQGAAGKTISPCFPILEANNFCNNFDPMEFDTILGECPSVCPCNKSIYTASGPFCLKNSNCEVTDTPPIIQSIIDDNNDNIDNNNIYIPQEEAKLQCSDTSYAQFVGDSVSPQCDDKCTCYGGYSNPPQCDSCPIQCHNGSSHNPLAYCQANLQTVPPCLCPDNTAGLYCQFRKLELTISLENYILPDWLVSSIQRNNLDDNEQSTLFYNFIIRDIYNDLNYTTNTIRNSIDTSVSLDHDVLSRISIDLSSTNASIHSTQCINSTPHEYTSIYTHAKFKITFIVGDTLESLQADYNTVFGQLPELKAKYNSKAYINRFFKSIHETYLYNICMGHCEEQFYQLSNCSYNGYIQQDNNNSGICNNICTCYDGFIGNTCRYKDNCADTSVPGYIIDPPESIEIIDNDNHTLQSMNIMASSSSSSSPVDLNVMADICTGSNSVLYYYYHSDSDKCYSLCVCPPVGYIPSSAGSEEGTENNLHVLSSTQIQELNNLVQEECSYHGIYIEDGDNNTCQKECFCLSGYSGDYCQHDNRCIDIINQYNECSQHGTIIYNEDTQQCDSICTCYDDKEWMGDTCEQSAICDSISVNLQCKPHGYVKITPSPNEYINNNNMIVANDEEYDDENDDDSNSITTNITIDDSNTEYNPLQSITQCAASCTCLFGYTGQFCSNCDVKCYNQSLPNPKAQCQTHLATIPPCSCVSPSLGRFCQYTEVITQVTIRNRSLPAWLVNSIQSGQAANVATRNFIDLLIQSINTLFNYENNTLTNTRDTTLIDIYNTDSIERTLIPLSGMSIGYTKCSSSNGATSNAGSSNDNDDINTNDIIKNIPSTLSFKIHTRVGTSLSSSKRERDGVYSQWNIINSTPPSSSQSLVYILQNVFKQSNISILGYDLASISCLRSYDDNDIDVVIDPEEEEEGQGEEGSNKAYNIYYNQILYLLCFLSFFMVFYVF